MDQRGWLWLCVSFVTDVAVSACARVFVNPWIFVARIAPDHGVRVCEGEFAARVYLMWSLCPICASPACKRVPGCVRDTYLSACPFQFSVRLNAVCERECVSVHVTCSSVSIGEGLCLCPGACLC